MKIWYQLSIKHYKIDVFNFTINNKPEFFMVYLNFF